MTHLKHNEDIKEHPYNLKADTCDICEAERPTGFWLTRTKIAVCFDCAVDALPKLIVDSWIHEMTDTKQAEKIEQMMRASFWKGVASRISQDAKTAAERKNPTKKA